MAHLLSDSPRTGKAARHWRAALELAAMLLLAVSLTAALVQWSAPADSAGSGRHAASVLPFGPEPNCAPTGRGGN